MALNFFSSSGKANRPPFEAAYAYIFSVLLGYFIADLSVTAVRPAMLPAKAPPTRPARPVRQKIPDFSAYSGITKRNIFNSDKKIPPPLSCKEGECGGGSEDNTPVLSQLPLSLEGTLVSTNPRKSIATINVKSKNETSSFMVDGNIAGLAKVVSIERRKVIFKNLTSRRLEFIEIPKDSAVKFGASEPAPKANEEVASDGNNFEMKRDDLNKYISNLGSVLNDARMVPNIIPGTGGKVEGFRFVSIKPGSIYEKLGFKPMDVIKQVNGEAVNSPTKAMELYNALRSESQIQLVVERNGRDENLKYSIK